MLNSILGIQGWGDLANVASVKLLAYVQRPLQLPSEMPDVALALLYAFGHQWIRCTKSVVDFGTKHFLIDSDS